MKKSFLFLLIIVFSCSIKAQVYTRIVDSLEIKEITKQAITVHRKHTMVYVDNKEEIEKEKMDVRLEKPVALSTFGRSKLTIPGWS